MTQEDKQLLLKDLCARLPYNVKGRVYAETTNGEYDINGDMIFFDSPFDVTLDNINTSTEEIHVIAIGNEDTVDFIEDQQICGSPYTIDDFKPYLRPMSNMTEEEKQWSRWYQKDAKSDNFILYMCRYEEWLDLNHFDWRTDDNGKTLIEKGLALEAPEGMYK